VTFRKYLVLTGVSIFPKDFRDLLIAVANPWVALGILFLLGFFVAYLTALSWADLTFVLPASSLGYVLLALLAKYFLHEQITIWRWMGILLISAGVGFVTQGPVLTHHHPTCADDEADRELVGSGSHS
jgi:drug/metabolite transporter (DMT)-like permease